MKFMMNGQRVTLKQVQGEEPVCPRCEHHNAMLYTTSFNNTNFRECRDCHLIVAHRESEGVVITRSIGKTCSNCHSFEMKETKPGSWMFKCQECDAPAVKY